MRVFGWFEMKDVLFPLCLASTFSLHSASARVGGRETRGMGKRKQKQGEARQ